MPEDIAHLKASFALPFGRVPFCHSATFHLLFQWLYWQLLRFRNVQNRTLWIDRFRLARPTEITKCIPRRHSVAMKCHVVLTLQLKIFPNAENVSYIALLSMLLSRFLINTFPTPDFLSDGSRCDHIILIGLVFNTSKFIVSSARSAKTKSLISNDVQHMKRV